MELFFAEKFPLRGALSIGHVIVETNPRLLLGNTFKRLSSFGEAQDWSGCVVLKEAEDIVVSNLLGADARVTRSSALVRRVPAWKPKIQERQELYCLNWSYLMPRALLRAGLEFMRGDTSKYTNTRDHVTWLETLPDDAISLSTEYAPAATLRVMKARAGCRLVFENAEGIRVDPGCDHTVAFFANAPTGGVMDAPPSAAFTFRR